MKTRILIAALWAALTGMTLAESPELRSLRLIRDGKVAAIDKQYVEALEKLRKKYMDAGALDDAVIAAAEIAAKSGVPATDEVPGENRLLGRWQYLHEGRLHIREFTAKGCTLSAEPAKGKPLARIWTKNYRLVAPVYAVVGGGEIHEILKDGKLRISTLHDGRSARGRKTSGPPRKIHGLPEAHPMPPRKKRALRGRNPGLALERRVNYRFPS